MIVHADDYGITVRQARAILALSNRCSGDGPLSSASIFVNSPAFEEAADLVRPYVAGGAAADENPFALGLHLNLVEGPCCANPAEVPLLVDERGMFKRDFVGLLLLGMGTHRAQAHEQIRRECAAQLERYFGAFPQMRARLQIDSHQHTHAIPLVFDAMMDAVRDTGAHLVRLRMPDEPLGPHRACGTLGKAGIANRVKATLLHVLCARRADRIPADCAVPTFCGVVLSGRMSEMTPQLAKAFEKEARRRSGAGSTKIGNADKTNRAKTADAGNVPLGAQAEILFHPATVPLEACLDPENLPFAQACASPERDAEARTISRLGDAEVCED